MDREARCVPGSALSDWKFGTERARYVVFSTRDGSDDAIAIEADNTGLTHEEMRQAFVLMAAAPELLEALEAIVSSAQPHPIEHPSMMRAWAQANAVITKARGWR